MRLFILFSVLLLTACMTAPRGETPPAPPTASTSSGSNSGSAGGTGGGGYERRERHSVLEIAENVNRDELTAPAKKARHHRRQRAVALI